MKSRLFLLINILLVVSMLLAACGKETATPAPTETMQGEEPIYLAIIWHQHQPVYFKDPVTGIYAKPWVRVHATKDYVDMATTVQKYPNIHVTFNLTPSLIRQLDDLSNGAKDLYWITAEVPADQLNEEQKAFLLERFFDTNRKIIGRFPRYQELLEKRDGGQEYTTQDFLDLQVLFNLAWMDPDWLAQEPLATLVTKGSNFAEDDKKVLFDEALRLIREVVPVHKEMQDAGQIEVTMTPYAHPILPLLVSTDLAKEAMPTVELPSKKFTYGQDAVAQVDLGVKLYEDHFGRAPRGMWPAEGSVAQEIVSMVSKAGIQWMASDEGVLAASLGMDGFARNANDTVTKPDVLYRPYYVQGSQGGPVAMVFRDVVISDKVGFTYSGLSGELAAKDFIRRIHDIRDALIEQGQTGPRLVTVILDGENAWENYDNDGKEFLNSLYEGLSSDPLIKTVTPSEFLSMAPDQPKIEKLWAGSWINHDFSTWIGEDEENRAWDYLATAREVLAKYESGIRQTSAENLLEAQMYMYIAEGSDWFWWYGSDQNSGNDEAFDQQFRDTLEQVYLALGEETPAFLGVPVIPQQPVGADMAATGLIQPAVDGISSAGEWDMAGVYLASGGVMAGGAPYFKDLAYGFDAKNLYLRVEALPEAVGSEGEGTVEMYLTAPGGGAAVNFSRNGTLLGFPANRLVELTLAGGSLTGANVYTAVSESDWGTPIPLEEAAMKEAVIEVAIPLEALGGAETGDRLSLRAVYSQMVSVSGTAAMVDTDQIPGSGPAMLAVPDLGTMTVVLDISDPEKDDYGPGSYVYPTDAVFGAGAFDILNFQVGYDAENVIFKFTMRGPVENVWNSPNGLSIQTFDIYIDKDGDGQGGNAFLPGRNLGLQEGLAWDYAITAEGWEAGIFTPGPEGPEKVASSSDFSIVADPGQQKVTIRVPKSILGDNPEAWKYAAMVLSQEGYPSGGVMRVRDVNAKAEQWRLGGAQDDANHTRVIDLVWAEAGKQEEWLSTYTPSSAQQTELSAADFAKVDMLAMAK
jgi:alpha-amylase/alpha-mannosidase (GH57 family)